MPLSTPSGPYAVSTLELELPAREVRAFAEQQVRLKGQPALRLESTLVTLFYPTQRPEKGARADMAGSGWLNSPRLKSIEGLLKYAGISKYFALPVLVPAYSVLFAKLPYAQNAPLAAPAQGARFPVGVFSHGLGGTRTTYSQYLSTLASHGVVVAAVEHRDGTAPSTSIYSRDAASGKESVETRTYLKHDELDKTDDGGAIEQMALRRAQLKLREAEMHEALSLLSRLNSGDAEPLLSSHLRGNVEALRAARLEEWKEKLDLSDVYALGHSFGGATCVALTSAADKPFTQALTLDPWLEPLLSDGASPPQPQRPLYIINSEYFSIWRSHMADVRALVARAPSKGHRRPWLLTLTGTKHTDFSDFPFLIPRLFASKVAPNVCIQAFARASLAQIHAGRAEDASTAASEGAGGDIKTLLAAAKLDVEVREEQAEEIQKRDMQEAGMLVVHSLPHAPEHQQASSAAAEAKL